MPKVLTTFATTVVNMQRTLDSLDPGDFAQIVEVNGEDAIAIRLMEMGVIDGEQIELIGRAPFGDPIEFRIRGSRLSLRVAEAQRVTVDSIQ